MVVGGIYGSRRVVVEGGRMWWRRVGGCDGRRMGDCSRVGGRLVKRGWLVSKGEWVERDGWLQECIRTGD